MSAEAIQLHAAPRQALLAEGGIDAALARVIERREAAAFLRGERSGRAQALASGVQRLDAALAEFSARSEAANATVVTDCVELALSIAAELVRSEVGARRHGIEALVRDTLKTSGVGRGSCKVHVSPGDAEVLAKLAFRAGTLIEADPDVDAACVQIETPQGLLVRDIDAALASIAARLREEAQS